MDIFEQWITKRNKSKLIRRALTDRSYKDIYRKNNKEELDDSSTNFNLATFGDAILKMCMMSFLFDEEQPSEIKKQFESDAYLVSVIAKKYDLIPKILKNDEIDMVMDYDYHTHNKYDMNGKLKGNKSKYIATAVEALFAAIFLETKDLNSIILFVQSWIETDKNKQ